MGSGKRSKVGRCNRVEEISGVEDPQQIAGNETAHGVSENREPGYRASFGREFVYFFVDLQQHKPKTFWDDHVREFTSWATLSPPLSIPS